jgi:hypothetical protein
VASEVTVAVAVATPLPLSVTVAVMVCTPGVRSFENDGPWPIGPSMLDVHEMSVEMSPSRGERAVAANTIGLSAPSTALLAGMSMVRPRAPVALRTDTWIASVVELLLLSVAVAVITCAPTLRAWLMLAPLPRTPSRSERHTIEAATLPSCGSVAVAVKVMAVAGRTLAKSAGALMLTTGRLVRRRAATDDELRMAERALLRAILDDVARRGVDREVVGAVAGDGGRDVPLDHLGSGHGARGRERRPVDGRLVGEREAGLRPRVVGDLVDGAADVAGRAGSAARRQANDRLVTAPVKPVTLKRRKM